MGEGEEQERVGGWELLEGVRQLTVGYEGSQRSQWLKLAEISRKVDSW